MSLSFEAWLLAWNVAYLFDRTPFYRPWLSWIGVDLRRLGVDDLVSLCVFFVTSLTWESETSSGHSSSRAGFAWDPEKISKSDIFLSATPFRLFTTVAAHRNILCEIP